MVILHHYIPLPQSLVLDPARKTIQAASLFFQVSSPKSIHNLTGLTALWNLTPRLLIRLRTITTTTAKVASTSTCSCS